MVRIGVLGLTLSGAVCRTGRTLFSELVVISPFRVFLIGVFPVSILLRGLSLIPSRTGRTGVFSEEIFPFRMVEFPSRIGRTLLVNP